MAWTAPKTWSVGEIVTASNMNLHLRDNTAYLHGDTGQVSLGATAGQTNALLTAVRDGNSIEFGHSNAAGYRGTLGDESSSGTNFLAFHGEAGTAGNTYRTRGVKASIFRADLTGGFGWYTVASANADSQAAIQLAYLDSNGAFTANQLLDAGGGTMRVHRHPYANGRHIESGTISIAIPGGGSGGSTFASVSFTNAFAAAPHVVASSSGGSSYCIGSASSASTTSVAIYGAFTPGYGPLTCTFDWIAEGQD